MSVRTKYAPRMMAARSGSRIGSGTGSRARIPAAAFAALLLAGCSSGHVGDDWQCPLAAGGSCASVAAADPAVPKTDAAPVRTPGQPIRLLPRETGPADTRSCTKDCGFGPFGWLARLFGEEDARVPETATPAAEAAVSPPTAPEPAAASADDDPNTDDLRTGETVARIWIAPFVDSDGVYREASHVRVVLEPAGWRLK